MIHNGTSYKTIGSTALAVEDRGDSHAKLIAFSDARKAACKDESHSVEPSSKDIALAFLPSILVGLLFFI